MRQQYLMSQGSPPRMEIAGLFPAEYRQGLYKRRCNSRGGEAELGSQYYMDITTHVADGMRTDAW
jgi:hypothetical protein